MGEKQEIMTDCTLCYHSCGTKVTVEDGKAVKIRGLESHPLNKGRLCPKGANALDVVYSPDRLKRPLKRVNGDFEEISWDQALGEIDEFIIGEALDTEPSIVLGMFRISSNPGHPPLFPGYHDTASGHTPFANRSNSLRSHTPSIHI